MSTQRPPFRVGLKKLRNTLRILKHHLNQNQKQSLFTIDYSLFNNKPLNPLKGTIINLPTQFPPFRFEVKKLRNTLRILKPHLNQNQKQSLFTIDYSLFNNKPLNPLKGTIINLPTQFPPFRFEVKKLRNTLRILKPHLNQNQKPLTILNKKLT